MRFQMYIDGQWRDSQRGGVWSVVNPATEETIATVPFGGEADAQEAVVSAAAAQPRWAAMTAYERGVILRKTADLIRDRLDLLAPIMTRECGKPLAEARGEWTACADLFDWFSEEGKRAYGRTIPARRGNKRLMSIPAPVGVVATITAWNFPAYLPVRKWSAALAAGCAVVARPSELTPMSAMAAVNLLEEAGLPPGVLNLVNGDPEAISGVFLSDPRVDKISFTGSQRVGRILMRGAAEGLKRLALELGGSAPVLVFDDVDVSAAAKQAVQAKFRNNGQVCISPTRFYVQAPLYEDFLESVRQEIDALVVGDGLQPGTTTGPLITTGARDRVESFVQDARSRGGVVVTGGARPADQKHGYFFQPTLITGVIPEMKVSHEEIFGPVMPVSPFHSIEEALQLANDTPYGLAAYALTRDMATAVRCYEGLKFGIVGVNDLVPATAEGPFGGMKQSGWGREGAEEGLHEYTEARFVSMAL
ncbi:MAG: NAD-dependent succinate-semialdehyde dehydrogenase [Anaerolineae bacterium]|nr:NAD-dependent succinate-semialdehyde dehydrogenase [Anaerolineae bacterium]